MLTAFRWIAVVGLVGFGLLGLLAGQQTACGICLLLALVVKP